jgi:hypothetical protein
MAGRGGESAVIRHAHAATRADSGTANPARRYRPHRLAGTGARSVSTAAEIFTPGGIGAGVSIHVPPTIGGSRAMAAASGRHAARLVFQNASVLIADLVWFGVGSDSWMGLLRFAGSGMPVRPRQRRSTRVCQLPEGGRRRPADSRALRPPMVMSDEFGAGRPSHMPKTKGHIWKP